MSRIRKIEFKHGKYQPVLSEENVLVEIMTRLALQTKVKVWRIRERIPGKWAPSTAGLPDLAGFIPGETMVTQTGGILALRYAIPLFIEVKRPGGARRPAQERFIQEALAGGCCAFFAESWDNVVSALAGYGIEFKEAR